MNPPVSGSPAAVVQQGPAERVSFQQAVERALARNPSVQEAVAEVLRAEALVQQARATSLPHVTANASYTRIDRERRFGPQVFTPLGTTAAGGTFSVPLVDLASWAQWAHAIDNRKIAELSSADVRRRIAVAAANSFLTVIAKRRELEVDQRSFDTAKAHLDVAHQRWVGGIASRLEEVQAAQEQSNDAVLIEQATIGMRRAQEALGVLLAADGPVDAADEPTFPGAGTAEEALAGLDERRTDVQLLSLRRSAAELVLRDSWRDYVPTLDFQFQEFYQHPATPVQPAHSWQAQLLLSLPLYDGGLRRGQVRERQALVQEAQANLLGGQIQARSDVRTAAEAIRLADQGLASAREAASQAHDALGISNLSYGAGAATSLDVLDSQRRARDADTAVAQAEDAARQARLDLLVASGRFP